MDEIKKGYTRVSQILSMIPSKSKEEKWGYPINDIDEVVLKNKANLGSHVHDAIAADIRGEVFPLTDEEECYFQSYVKWRKEVNLEPVISEKRLNHDLLKITGRPDMLAYISSSFKLLDFKCTMNEDKKKWKMQAAFYLLLCEYNEIVVDQLPLFIKLDKEGGFPKVYEYDIEKENLKTLAISALNIYRFLS